jgi:hypothetical protein
MKKLFLSIIFFLPLYASAQELITTVGGAGNTVVWSIGGILTFALTDAGQTASVTPGLLQPEHLFPATAIASPSTEAVELYAYPNPVRDELHIRLQTVSASWKLFDSVGRTVHAGEYSDSEQVISFRNYPSGCYILRATSPEGTQSIKIIK